MIQVPIPSFWELLRLLLLPLRLLPIIWKRCLPLLSFSLKRWADRASAWTTEPLRIKFPSSPQPSISLCVNKPHTAALNPIKLLGKRKKKGGINRTIYLAFFLPFRFFSDAVVVSSTTKKVAGGVTPQSSPADCKHSLKQDRTYVRIIRNLFQKGERKRERLLKVASVFRWSVLLLLRPCGGIQKTAQKDTTEDSAVDVFDVSQ